MTPVYARYFIVLWLFRNQVIDVNITVFSTNFFAIQRTQSFITSWGATTYFRPVFVMVQTSTLPLPPYLDTYKGINILTSCFF